MKKKPEVQGLTEGTDLHHCTHLDSEQEVMCPDDVTDTGTPKWNAATINVRFCTCASPAATSRRVCSDEHLRTMHGPELVSEIWFARLLTVYMLASIHKVNIKHASCSSVLSFTMLVN